MPALPDSLPSLVFWAVARPALLAWLLLWVPARAAGRALWMKLVPARPTPRLPAASGAAPQDFDVVCLSHVAWPHVWQRNHHTMTRLARGRRVLYLQVLPTSYVHALARLMPESLTMWRARHPAVPTLAVRQALLMPADSKLSAVRRFNDWSLAVDIRWLVRRLGMARRPVLWFYHPAGVGCVDHLTGPDAPAAVVYDVQDEYSAFRNAPRQTVEREARLLAAADVLLAGTHELFMKKGTSFRGHAEATRFFPCAVEFDHFHGPVERPADYPEPPEMDGLPRPRLIYVGLIDGRIDAALLDALAAARPDLTIVMVGPVEQGGFDADALAARRPNIRFLGQMPYARLPALLAWCDVCLMPWAVNELTMHINPTKTLEYLATAKPTVAVALPDLTAFFSDCVALAPGGDHGAFIAAVDDALAGRRAGAVEAGLIRARALAWETVVDEMADMARMALARKGLQENESQRKMHRASENRGDPR